jgi:hypothetical protein
VTVRRGKADAPRIEMMLTVEAEDAGRGCVEARMLEAEDV